MQRPDLLKSLIFAAIVLIILTLFFIGILANRISILEGEDLSIKSVIRSFDLLYEIVVLPYGNIIHSVIALLMATAVLSTLGNRRGRL